MDGDLPYSVEYAKSGRASCQNCKTSIAKDSLRLAAIVQSPVHDGKIPKWYHAKCFFLKQRPQSTADIANFDNIRWEDQQDVRKKLEEAALLPPVAGKGRKRGGAKATGSAGASEVFSVQYAKSSRSTCKGCEEKIVKGEIRVSKKDFESDEARRYGGLDRWHHLECFAKIRNDLNFLESGDILPGAKDLSKEDQQTLKQTLPKVSGGDVPPVKKLKKEPEDEAEEAELQKQNKELFKIRDQLSEVKKNDLIAFLEKNAQQIPEGTSNILDRLADMVCFGALKPCPKCRGQLVYTSGSGYKCTGDLTEWSKCEYVTQNPDRKKYSVPSDIKEDYPSISLKPKVKRRVIKITAPSSSSSIKKEDEVDAGPKVKGAPKPLKHMSFVIMGRTEKDKEELKRNILLLGGNVITSMRDDLAAVISNVKEVEKMSKRMESAQSFDIQVVPEDFIEAAKDYSGSIFDLIKEKNIASWGSEPSKRLDTVISKSGASKSKSKFEKSGSGTVKMQIKGGTTIDPDSGLQDVAHVYQKGKEKFTATLVYTDVQTKKNSYYKLQILKHDKKSKYWLFRSWGRIGTTIGGTKVQDLALEEAIEQFEDLYEEKTGNTWEHREDFVKVPQKMYPIDIDHGEEKLAGLESNIKSDLEEPLQELMKLIFDEANMKRVMSEFEIDTDKMPLGKLSKKQIQKAYAVLTELQDILKKGNPDRSVLIDASNRFYNLIPHNFGISGPPLLDKTDEIHQKCDMLDALLEMEIAYSLLHGKTDETKNPLDAHYEQLKADISVLDRSSEEFKVIQQYVKNTHAETHTQYDLEIEDVFTVKRQGEEKRYKPFKKLSNKKLLWHGSRTTNFAGILLQGLRIAPPEAPVTGYMFGKGIYFADMVSKSANYCCATGENPTGLLLLCEVALGNMYERYQADYIEKLPKGKHSVIGCGQTHPDPKTVHKTDDGIEIPYGAPVPAKVPKHNALLYNEYIVYDVAQVQTRYLLRMKFKFKH